MFVNVTSKAARFYFALFYFVCVLVMLSLMVAFVLDMFAA